MQQPNGPTSTPSSTSAANAANAPPANGDTRDQQQTITNNNTNTGNIKPDIPPRITQQALLSDLQQRKENRLGPTQIIIHPDDKQQQPQSQQVEQRYLSATPFQQQQQRSSSLPIISPPSPTTQDYHYLAPPSPGSGSPSPSPLPQDEQHPLYSRPDTPTSAGISLDEDSGSNVSSSPSPNPSPSSSPIPSSTERQRHFSQPFSSLVFGSDGGLMTSVIATSHAPVAFGVWAYYIALGSALLCLFYGPFSIIWWWYSTSALYTDTFNIGAGVYSIAMFFVIIYEETEGLPVIQTLGSFFDVTVSRYNLRSLLYVVFSSVLFLSWPTVIPAFALIFTAAINRVACARGEVFRMRLGIRKIAASHNKKKEHINIARRICNKVTSICSAMIHLRHHNALGVVFWLSIYTGGNVALFVLTELQWIHMVQQSQQQFDQGIITDESQVLSYWITIAKAFGLVLDLNCALILLPVCHSLIRWLYEYSTRDQRWYTIVLRYILKAIPLDHHLAFHRIIGMVILIASIGHTLAHFVNYALKQSLTLSILGGPWALISGGFLWGVILLMYSSTFRRVRVAHFELFFETHHLFIFFFILLLVHGAHGVGPNFWKYFIAPGAIYICERFYRIYRGQRPVELLSAQFMHDVVCLEFKKTGVFKPQFRVGQYILLQCPTIAPLQWHPFTISSAPRDPTVTVHIKISVDKPTSFTYRVAAYLAAMRPTLPPSTTQDTTAGEEEGSTDLYPRLDYILYDRADLDISHGYRRIPGRLLGPDGRPLFRIDGPHSAPAQHLSETNVSLIVAAGIGATPLAACLRHVVHHEWNQSIGECYPSRAYFVWLVAHKDINSFRWLLKLVRETQQRISHMRHTGAMNNKWFEFHIYVTSPPEASDRKKDIRQLLTEMRVRKQRPPSPNPIHSIPLRNVPIIPNSYGIQKTLQWDDYRLALQMSNPSLKANDPAAKWKTTIPLDRNDHVINISPTVSTNTSPTTTTITTNTSSTATATATGNTHPGTLHHFEDIRIYSGRPNWDDIFSALAQRHRKEQIGVMFCGTPVIAKDLRDQCAMKNSTRGTDAAQFILHAENF